MSRSTTTVARVALRVKVQEPGSGIRGSGKHLIVQADVAKEDQVIRMFARVIDARGSLDILVNNSGIHKAVPSHELEMADISTASLGINLRGAFLCSRGYPAFSVARQERCNR